MAAESALLFLNSYEAYQNEIYNKTWFLPYKCCIEDALRTKDSVNKTFNL